MNFPAIAVRDTGTPRGRGVYALRDFAAGEIVEESPVVVLTSSYYDFPDELKRMVFAWGLLCKSGGDHAIALGFGSLYNHANPANLRYAPDPGQMVMRFTAVRQICPEEELTVNYAATGGGAEWHNDDWFERMNVKLL